MDHYQNAMGALGLRHAIPATITSDLQITHFEGPLKAGESI